MMAQRLASVVALVAALTGFRTVAAQTFNYPSMQVPQVSVRDFTAAAVATSQAAALLQWREAITDYAHFGLEAGFGDPERVSRNALTFVGVHGGYQLLDASDGPFDLVLTAGFGATVGSEEKTVRVPVGASIGHRFEAESGKAFTPYIHPRISFDRCTKCHVSDVKRRASTNVDLGFNVDVTTRLAVRASGSFSASDRARRNDSYAIGIVWMPTAPDR